MPFGTSNTMNSSSSRGTPAEDGKVLRSSLAETNCSGYYGLLLLGTHEGHSGALQLTSRPPACVVPGFALEGQATCLRIQAQTRSFTATRGFRFHQV